MPNVQVRKFPDDVYARITQAAAREERSIEGEVRLTLFKAYPDAAAASLSRRERWQRDTATRLIQLQERLRDNKFLPRHRDIDAIGLAKLMGELTPAYLLDCLDGEAPLSFDAAERLATVTDSSAEWLLEGTGSMFPVEHIGNHYHTFFTPDAPGDYRFHLIREGKGAGHKSLLCIRHNRTDNRYVIGSVHGQFYLGDGMGSGGMGNLMRFLQYIKKHYSMLQLSSYILDAEDAQLGEHHPNRYLKSSQLETSGWLASMLEGNAPGSWLTDFSWHLNVLKDTPYGEPDPAAETPSAEI